jgi:2-phosphosulfolactate phosphatase
MAEDREVRVYLLPELAPPERLRDGVAVVVDVLRATTSIVHALAAGCTSVRPCVGVDEARSLADGMRAGRVLLAGERGGEPIPGFDLGNSPRGFTARTCRDVNVVLTTTNGTKALLRCTPAARTLIAAFVNYSAICEQLRHEKRPVSIVCAGTDGDVTLEDTLLAGALVDFLTEVGGARLNDGARLAWDCFETHGCCLHAALELSQGAQGLKRLGYSDDIQDAAQVDEFALVPELRVDPPRVEVGAAGIVKSYWMKKP